MTIELTSAVEDQFNLRRQAVDYFIGNDHKICPYAPDSIKIYHQAPETGDTDTMKDLLQGFMNMEGLRTLVLLFKEDHQKFEEAKEATLQTIAEHTVAMNTLSGGQFNIPFFIFYMGPIYSTNHPRYCPHSTLLFNYESDFDKVPERIRAEILKRAIDSILCLTEKSRSLQDLATRINYPLDQTELGSDIEFMQYILEILQYQGHDFLIPKPYQISPDDPLFS